MSAVTFFKARRCSGGRSPAMPDVITHIDDSRQLRCDDNRAPQYLSLATLITKPCTVTDSAMIVAMLFWTGVLKIIQNSLGG